MDKKTKWKPPVFSLLEKEAADAQKFEEEHSKHKRFTGNIPSYFKYAFSPNGIGCGVIITCPYCGVSKDITDVESW